MSKFPLIPEDAPGGPNHPPSELLHEVHRDLQVLRLVEANRHLVAVDREDVGGHEQRVAVEADVHAVVRVAAGRDVGCDRRVARMEVDQINRTGPPVRCRARMLGG